MTAGSDSLGLVEDLGQPSSYLTLAQGTPVYSSDGENIGAVEHVLAAEDEDIFDGIVIDRSVLPGGHRFVDAPHIEEIYDRGLVLKLDRAAADALPEPGENPAVMDADPAEAEESELTRKLRRAWDLISGNY
jgi:uncharacterized protein YrrD